MSPKRPIKPGTSTALSETPFFIPDATPATPHRLPPSSSDFRGAEITVSDLRLPVQTPPNQPAMIEVFDLPADTHITPVFTQVPIKDFFLSQSLLAKLPQPNGLTGIRELGTMRHYVDLEEGGTVFLGRDPQGHYRAKLNRDFIPSGPRVERVEGTLKWRVKPNDVTPEEKDSRLTIKRLQTTDSDTSEAGAAKRPSLSTDSQEVEPWRKWRLPASQPLLDSIEVEGAVYPLLPGGGDQDHPIVYIKNPEHGIYDFDYMEQILSTDLLQQPRGAISVPPANDLKVDPNLPFQKPLTQYLAAYFPQLSKRSTDIVSRQQFVLANDGNVLTGVGLTRLRQTFNDWKSGSRAPRPQLVDPILMLSTLPTLKNGPGSDRTLELPALPAEGVLQRLDFDLTQQEWSYFKSTQSGLDLKRLMAGILQRQGYDVFPPTTWNSFPALVFRRKNHSMVYFISLYRIRGRKIHQPLSLDPDRIDDLLTSQIGQAALQAVLQAKAENRLIWLKGGSQNLASQPDTIFIVRDDYSRLETTEPL